MQVDVVFYEVTTFSFESAKADTLREFGFSKDGKFNEVQVVLGLLVDCEGRPIGYELFPGNTFDGKTLDTALEKLKKRFGIRRVIIVADRGLR
jgi:transposase